MFLSSVMSLPESSSREALSSNNNHEKSIFQCPEYQKFRSNIALKRVVVDDDTEKVWSYYEAGPKDVKCPVIFLPPVSGTADVFFYQMQYLVERGHRVLSVHYPTYFTMREFCNGFQKLLRNFDFQKVHLVGASLGGFLAQKFAQFNRYVVASLVLCNSFGDTSRFKYVNMTPLLWFAPSSFLRKYFVSVNVPEGEHECVRLSAHFMKWTLHSLSQQELVSRLSLNLTYDYVSPNYAQNIPVTLIDVNDLCSNSSPTKLEMYKLYPNAKRAHLKRGGNFPYLSEPEDVNLHLLVHLRRFNNTESASCVHYLNIIQDIVEEAEDPLSEELPQDRDSLHQESLHEVEDLPKDEEEQSSSHSSNKQDDKEEHRDQLI